MRINLIGVGLLLLLGACGVGPTPSLSRLPVQFGLELGTDDVFFVPAALDATAAQFFGGIPGGVPGLFPFVEIDGATLSPGSGTIFQRQTLLSTGLSAKMVAPITLRTDFSATVVVSLGNSQFYLPEGVGILIDPITIAFKTKRLSAEFGLVSDRKLVPSLTTKFSAGVGGTIVRADTAVTSALLDVLNHSQQRNYYLYGGVDISPAKTSGPLGKFTLKTRVKKYIGVAPIFQSTLALSF